MCGNTAKLRAFVSRVQMTVGMLCIRRLVGLSKGRSMMSFDTFMSMARTRFESRFTMIRLFPGMATIR
jgi:hypothetical protein